MPNKRKTGTTLLVIPVNPAQKSLIREAAKRNGLSMAPWVRQTLRKVALRSEAAAKSSKRRDAK